MHMLFSGLKEEVSAAIGLLCGMAAVAKKEAAHSALPRKGAVRKGWLSYGNETSKVRCRNSCFRLVFTLPPSSRRLSAQLWYPNLLLFEVYWTWMNPNRRTRRFCFLPYGFSFIMLLPDSIYWIWSSYITSFCFYDQHLIIVDNLLS